MANGKKAGRKWLWIALLVVVVAGGLGFTALSRAKPTIDKSKLARVERGDLAKSVVATGKIEPLSRVEIKSKASGIIKTLLVNVGDTVREGQVLIELDKENLEARVREARAAVQAADANVKAARANYERTRTEAEGPEVPFARRNMERAQQLHRDGLIPLSQVEDAEKMHELARNRQQTALGNLAVTRAQIDVAEAQLGQARAALDRADEELRNSTLRSPLNGVVLSRDREVGDAVSSILVLGSQATLIMTLGDMREVYVKGKVDEADIGKVYLSQPARITVESFKDRKFTGKVTKISPMGAEKDNVTTFEVRVSIENKAGELKALMTANAEILLEEHKNVLTVPEGALVFNKDKTAYVEVPDPSIKEGKRKAPVQVVISNGSRAEVTGLKEGQEVILQ
jgi:HlyD family secretion protein